MNSSVRPVSPGLELVGEGWITFKETQSCHVLASIAVHRRLFHDKIQSFIQELILHSCRNYGVFFKFDVIYFQIELFLTHNLCFEI